MPNTMDPRIPPSGQTSTIGAPVANTDCVEGFVSIACAQAQEEKVTREREQQQADAQEQERKRQEQEHNRQEKIKEELARKQAELQEQEQQDLQGGYTQITFDDFQLDGNSLGKEEKKVSIHGYYVRNGDNNYLYENVAVGSHGLDDLSIPLLIDDAERASRLTLLHCQDREHGLTQLMLGANFIGCEVTILGNASICSRERLGNKSHVACIVVDRVREKNP